MSENIIKTLYETRSNLEYLKSYLSGAKEECDKAINDIKEIDNELIKNHYVPWFEFIKFAFSDEHIDFNLRDKYKEFNNIFSLDFGLDAHISNLSPAEIKNTLNIIKTAARDVKTSIENNNNCDKYNTDILEKIYKSIDSIDFLNLIGEIISENSKNNDNIFNQVKGKYAEYKFIEFLNKNNKAFFYIDNNKNTMCKALNYNGAKRPDLILILDRIFKVFVDVKNYSINKNNKFGINKKDIDPFINLEERYSIPVFLAISNGKLQFNTWYFVSVNKIFEDKKDLINDSFWYIDTDDPIFYKTDAANKFDDKFLIANNQEILNNVKIMAEYFKSVS
jgi:hypothetical protein